MEMDHMNITVDKVYEWLSGVKDPEIPVLSLVDLGVITNVSVDERKVTVEMTPTFVGCPALEQMQQEVREVIEQHGASSVTVNISFKKPWSSDLITENGRAALKSFGIAPPQGRQLFADLGMLEHPACPRCGGTDTEIRNLFGPTLCRSIHYCHHCHEAFEQFKSL